MKPLHHALPRPSSSAAMLFAAVALTVPAVVCGAANTTGSSKQTPFVAALMGHFDAWDLDHDGTLESPEIDRAVADPHNTGDAAAAAASLRLVSRSTKLGPIPPLTRGYFVSYNDSYNDAAIGKVGHESAAAAENATLDPNTERASDRAGGEPATRPASLPPDWDRNFLAAKARIAKGGADSPPWPADATPARFALGSMKQGPLGDCFFIATVGSMAVRSPERLATFITPIEGGRYRVTFPGADAFEMNAPTPAMRALSSTTADAGAWMAVLEQAYGKYRARLKGRPIDDVDGTDVLRVGGDSSVVIVQLTGHGYDRISFARTAEGREAKADEVLPKLRKAIKENIAAHRLITAGVNPPSPSTQPSTQPDTQSKTQAAGTLPTIPPGIVKKHVYAVVTYDEQTDTLELWNPHSNTFVPKGPAGLANGYTTEGGRFKLPLGEAYRFYTSFTFETDTRRPGL